MTKPFNVLDYERRGSGGKYKDLYVAVCLRDHLRWYAENGYTQRDVCVELGAVDTSVWMEARAQGLLDQFRENKRKYKQFQDEHGYPPYWPERLNDYGWPYPSSVEDLRKAVHDRFWRLVEVKGAEECWPWRGGIQKSGYGITFSLRHGARALIAFPRKGIASPHRVAYCLHHGGIDATLTVDHLCHNPRCCNPAHLRQCTKSENSANPWYKRLTERPAHLPPLKPGRKPITPSLSKEKALSPEREQGTSSPTSPQDDRQRLGSKNESQSVPDQDGAA